MLELESVSFKNFLSVGNNPIKYTLNTHQNTCIVGKNGFGKSLISDAITFALFGKGFRKINKGQLINTINDSDCLVTLKLTYNGKKYVIKRGIKPNILEITVNGVKRKMLSTLKDEQQWLENTLRLNYKTFIHIVILGNCNYVPFMEKTASERRQFIEDTLGLTEYSNMKLVTKDKIKIVTNNIKDTKKDISSLEATENVLKKSISNLEKVLKQQKEDKDKRREEFLKNIKKYETELKQVKAQKLKLKELLVSKKDPLLKARSLEKKKNNLNRDKKKYREDISIYKDNVVCPTCHQTLTDEFVSQKLSEVRDSVLKVQEDIDIINTLIEENEKEIEEYNELKNSISELNYQENLLDNNIDMNKNLLEALDSEHESLDDLYIMKNDLDNYRTQKASLNDSLETLEKELEMLEKILNSYEPVKQKTIDNYIPAINNYLNKYLKILGLDATFKFDSEFKEYISTKYKEEYSYSSFSEGEKMRINLALLLTWREIGKIKNSFNCNLLILDEVCDSSMDLEGMSAFLELVKRLDGNVFIISHREEVVTENFDCVVKVSKKRFSSTTVM